MGEIVVGAACKIAENDGRTLMDSTASNEIAKSRKSSAGASFFPIIMGVAMYV